MNTKVLNEQDKVKRSKELIMRLTANGKLYYEAFIQNLKQKSPTAFRNCSSPFRRDKNPSFNISNNASNNIWYHKDFGDPSVQGDVFDFAARRHGLDRKVNFMGLLDKMYEELEIDQMDKNELQRLMNGSNGTNETITYSLRIPKLSPRKNEFDETYDQDEDKKKIYAIELIKIQETEFDSLINEFLNKTGINYKVMEKHNACFISGYIVRYTKNGKGGMNETRKYNNQIWICYHLEELYAKIYSPISKGFWSIGEKSSGNKYVFGTPNLKTRLEDEIVILAAGEKDTLALLSRGYYAMCLNSETANFSIADKNYYHNLGYKIVIIYDLDTPGFENSNKINKETAIPYVTLPHWLNDQGGKDVTDYFILGGTKEDLDILITQALNNQPLTDEIPLKLLPVRTAAQRLKDAQSKPDILPHADVLFQSNELTVFFGDTGKGKSIFAVALADAISKGISFLSLENKCEPLKVLYYDFELSDKQFEKRYTNDNGEPYIFNDNFFIDNIDLSDIDFTNKKISFDDHLIKKIRSDIKELSANVLIIDNITFLSTFSAEDGQVAMRLMKQLKDLKAELQISVMVLAHTPKKFGLGGISLPDLAGSKHLSNFCDSVTALGASKKDTSLRYIIQVKPSRTGEIKYDAQNVIVCEIQKVDSFLTLVFKGFAPEDEHLAKRNEDDEEKLIEDAKELQKLGKTYRQIADDLKVSKSTIGRWLKIE